MENKVLAVVEGTEITQTNVNEFLQSMDPQTAMQFQNEEGMKRIVEELINQELMYLDAKDRKLEEDPIYTLEVEKAKVNLLKQYAFRKLLADIKVTDEEAKEYYEKNKENFKTPEKLRASHILVEDEDKAMEIYEEVLSGDIFEDKAVENSKCQSKDRGGDLGFFEKGNMVKEFEDVAFEMEIGEISKPVKTQFGYHIIKLVDIQEKADKKYEEVENEVKNNIFAQKQQETYLKRIEELKNKYSVENK